MQTQVEFGEAISRKYPEAVVLAIARDTNGVPNPIALGWSMMTSFEPPMLAISIGKTRYSCDVVRSAGEFVLSFPSDEMAEEVLFYGTRSGRDVAKLKEYGADTAPAAAIDCVILANAVANFECRVAGELDTGDHVIFAGEVVAAHVGDRPARRLYSLGKNHKLGSVTEG
jgi:flavin reductase (DIM6/NTAB) family NADH-FMN oxidoreductase RutF